MFLFVFLKVADEKSEILTTKNRDSAVQLCMQSQRSS
jgi:hypothetical protein